MVSRNFAFALKAVHLPCVVEQLFLKLAIGTAPFCSIFFWSSCDCATTMPERSESAFPAGLGCGVRLPAAKRSLCCTTPRLNRATSALSCSVSVRLPGRSRK